MVKIKNVTPVAMTSQIEIESFSVQTQMKPFVSNHQGNKIIPARYSFVQKPRFESK